MRVVQDYTKEAKAEILAVLRERVRRMGECLISHTNLRAIVEKRFGLNGPSASKITFAVEDDLKESGILEIWQENDGTSGTIFSVKL